MTDEIMHWRKGSHDLYAFGRVIQVSCDVRNEVNGRRHETEIAKSLPDEHPYQPRQFPKGLWSVSRPLARESKWLAPFYIPTDAWREMPIWAIEDKRYKAPTDKTTIDRGYGLHYSESPTTLGCIKIESRDDLLWLVDQINNKLNAGLKVFLDVHL